MTGVDLLTPERGANLLCLVLNNPVLKAFFTVKITSDVRLVRV